MHRCHPGARTARLTKPTARTVIPVRLKINQSPGEKHNFLRYKKLLSHSGKIALMCLFLAEPVYATSFVHLLRRTYWDVRQKRMIIVAKLGFLTDNCKKTSKYFLEMAVPFRSICTKDCKSTFLLHPKAVGASVTLPL